MARLNPYVPYRAAARHAVLGLAAAAMLSGCAGGEPRAVVQAFDVTDGRLLWSAEVGARASATEPVIVGDAVFVGPDAYGLADRRRRWVQRQAGRLPDAVSGDLAVFSLEGRVEARRVDTGAVAWTRRRPGRLVHSHEDGPIALVVEPGAASRTEVAPGPDLPPPPVAGTVSLLDPATGRDLWKTVLPGRVEAFFSAVSTRHLLAGHRTDHSGAMTVAALRLRDGSTAWSVPVTSAFSRVTSADGIPALTSGGEIDHASVLDPRTGKQLWESSGFTGPTRRWPSIQIVSGYAGYAGRRDPRTGAELPGRVRPRTASRGTATCWSAPPGGRSPLRRAAEKLWTAPLPRSTTSPTGTRSGHSSGPDVDAADRRCWELSGHRPASVPGVPSAGRARLTLPAGLPTTVARPDRRAAASAEPRPARSGDAPRRRLRLIRRGPAPQVISLQHAFSIPHGGCGACQSPANAPASKVPPSNAAA